jgi:lambda family phage minor tail protein L
MAGVSRDSQNSPPQPTLSISNVDKVGTNLVDQYGDLLGAKVTKIKTYSKYLDVDPVTGLANPLSDPNAHYLPETWFIMQKQTMTEKVVQFRLKSAMDLDGLKIPARVILKNVCMHRYRVWNATTGAFDYPAKNACPYTGATYFTRDNAATADPSLDQCRKDLDACKARFGSAPLPTWAFPGANRLPGQ